MLCCKIQEALRNNGQPDDVLLTSIWRLAGQVLLDVPDCPVQLAQGVVYGWCVVREWLYCADLVGTRVDVSRSLWRPRPLLRRVIVLHLGC